MASFDNVYISPRVRVALNTLFEATQVKKFWQIVDKLRERQFEIPGMHVEKLHCKGGRLYSARLNVDLRIIFSMYENKKARSTSLVIWDANHHDDAYERAERLSVPAFFEAGEGFLKAQAQTADQPAPILSAEPNDDDEITSGLLLFEVPPEVLSEPARYGAFQQEIDRYLRLTPEQEDLLKKKERAHLVRGTAGTGKTTLALFHALNLYEQYEDDDIFFFTYQSELASVCRSYKVNLLGGPDNEDQDGLQVFSYVDFCRNYLRRHAAGERSDINWKWIDRDESIKLLKTMIASRSRWSRALKAEDVYGYFYSIFKGRFVPGTSKLPQNKEDFQRIFKDYGQLPYNFDMLLEIFAHYEEQLTMLKQKDEADLIRYCYETLKQKAILTDADHGIWIVIDEIQDFTELEWKSILLFWENQCIQTRANPTFPFLSGDVNQNISRSGFRWQEAETYIQSILTRIHRPNAITQSSLHQNLRNTGEIFDLGKLIRASAGDAATDLGTRPHLSGRKPKVVVGSMEEFAEFVGEITKSAQATSAPQVILFESDAALDLIKNKYGDSEGVFLMPLKSSKGMEFEDLIVCRLFASAADISDEEIASRSLRLFDLWYMAVTRARQNLLIFITTEDLKLIQRVLGARYEQFLSLVQLIRQDPLVELRAFYEQREKYLPNYAVVFLDRIRAENCWSEFQEISATQPAGQADEAARKRDKALELWQKCHDFENLGKAYIELGNYEKAIEYLEKCGQAYEAAVCYEKLKNYSKAAQCFLEADEILRAARCYELSKDYLKAAELFEQQEEWLQAATNYYLCEDNLRAAPCFEKAKMWKSAADLYRSKSQFIKAANLYVLCDDHAQAAEMFLKGKDKLDAAKYFVLSENWIAAAEQYESLSRWAEAGECYERCGQLTKSAVLFEKGGRLKEAARCYEQTGNFAQAADNHERMRQYDRAAECHLSAGQKQKAAEAYEKQEEWRKALNIWTELGNHLKMGRCLEAVGDLAGASASYLLANARNEAAYCYEKLERYKEAADLYLQANNPSQAASMLAKAGERLDAAKLYLMAGQAQSALTIAAGSSEQKGNLSESDLRFELAMWADENKRLDFSAAIYEANGNFAEAAQRYQQAMLTGKAAECYQKCGRFLEAALLYMQSGAIERAAECFKSDHQFGKAGECYELIKQWDKALEMYEKTNDQAGIERCKSASNWL